MASTYSTNLRIELQTTGENRGSWGTKANTGYNLLEEAVTGYEQVNMADANVTLTAVNGATDQARNMFIKLNGPNTATRSCTIPAVPKMYFIWNATGQTVNVRTGGSPTPPLSATQAVLNGTWRVLWTDGSAVWSTEELISQSVSGARWNATPYIDSSGVMEVGAYIDFHNTGGDTSTYNVRLATNLTNTDLYIAPEGGSYRKVWNQGNDGAGSGMDADTVDGLHASSLIFPDAPSDSATYGRRNAAWVTVSGDVGSVVFFARNSPPLGYLKANGASVLRTTYPALFTAIGVTFGAVDATHFNLPDMRGEFVRGWNDDRGGVDPLRAFGSFQGDSFESHIHTTVANGIHDHTGATGNNTTDHVHSAGTLTAASDGAHSHGTGIRSPSTSTTYIVYDTMTAPGTAQQGAEGGASSSTVQPITQTTGNHTHDVTGNTGNNTTDHVHGISDDGSHTHTINPTGGTETRPRNIALLACIKFQ